MIDWMLNDIQQELSDGIRAEVRRLWNSGAIDTEDAVSSFNACLYVALRNVADNRKPRSKHFSAVVKNLESF